METPFALHSVPQRVSHQIPAESEMSRQNRATAPQIKVAPFSAPPCRTFLSFAAGRGRGELVEGIAALLGSENGSRYRGVSQLQSHQSRYSVQLSRKYPDFQYVFPMPFKGMPFEPFQGLSRHFTWDPSSMLFAWSAVSWSGCRPLCCWH